MQPRVPPTMAAEQAGVSKIGFFFIFTPFVASSRHRPAGPGVSGLGPGLRGGVQCRAKPEAEGELSLYSLWVRPPWPPACCTAAPETGKHHAQWLSDCFIGMFLPPPPMGRHAGRARAVGALFRPLPLGLTGQRAPLSAPRCLPASPDAAPHRAATQWVRCSTLPHGSRAGFAACALAQWPLPRPPSVRYSAHLRSPFKGASRSSTSAKRCLSSGRNFLSLAWQRRKAQVRDCEPAERRPHDRPHETRGNIVPLHSPTTL